MPDYLTKRNGYWHFVRRVPLDLAHLDERGVIKHSTKVPVAKDRRGVKAGEIADEMNRELEAFWRGLSEGKGQAAAERYAETRRRFRVTAALAIRPTISVGERLEKLEKLMTALLTTPKK